MLLNNITPREYCQQIYETNTKKLCKKINYAKLFYMERMFQKNDDSFVCTNCGAKVEKLGYTSRDHCNKCLCSIHIDINPGDRANTCKGLLIPISATISAKKGYVITYRCEKCGQTHNNKAADDDKQSTLFSVMNGTYNHKKTRP